MKFVSRSASYLLLGLTLTMTCAPSIMAVGQTANQSPPAAASKAMKADSTATPQQRALALLNQLLGQTKVFTDLSKSLKIALFQTQAADLLWDYDQARARSVYEDAVKSANGLLRKRPAGRPLSFNEAMEYSQVCDELIDSALAHDAAFAERLASLTLVPLQADEGKGEAFDREYRRQRASLYSQLAKHIAASDPQHAAELLRLAFNGWYGSGQIGALSALRRHAPALADEIFLNAMAAIRNKPAYLSSRGGILAAYVFPDITNETGIALYRAGEADLQAQVSPTLIKSFLEFVYDSFMPQPVAALTAENNEFGSAAFDYYTMKDMIGRFERHLPDKAAAFRARVEEVIASIRQAGREDMFDREGEMLSELLRSNIQDWIKKAETAKTQQERDYNYIQAISVLIYRDGDLEQALALMAKLSDAEQIKASMYKTIREEQVRKAIYDGDAEGAYRYLKDVPTRGNDLDFRTNFLLEIARLFGKSGKVERAKAVLAEARQLMVRQPDTAGELIRRATVAAEIDPAYGFQSMKEAIAAINASAPSKEVSGHSWGDRKVNFDYRHDFDDNLGELARVDFNRALELARCIEPKAVSLLAQFSVCKGVLGKSEPATDAAPNQRTRKSRR